MANDRDVVLISFLVFPTLLQDITSRADKWGNDGKSGRINPFAEIYDVSFFSRVLWDWCRVCTFQLVFLMTARMTTCHDLVKNEADLKRIGEVFMTLQTIATPVSLLLPWFPSPARKTGKQAATELYTLLHTYVETRRHAMPTSDAIDILIVDGETTQNIVGVSPGLEVVRFSQV